MLKRYILLLLACCIPFQVMAKVDIQITNNVGKKMTAVFNNDGAVTTVYPGGASAFWGLSTMDIAAGGTPTVKADKNNETITSTVSGDTVFADFTISEKRSGNKICKVKLTGCATSMKTGIKGCGGFFLKSLNQYVCSTGIIGANRFIVTIKKEPRN